VGLAVAVVLVVVLAGQVILHQLPHRKETTAAQDAHQAEEITARLVVVVQER
jgi:hypothetical protein